MGEVETLTREFKNTPSEEELKERLREVRHEIHREWKSFKQYHRIMHGVSLKDNRMDMLLVYLIRRGIL